MSNTETRSTQSVFHDATLKHSEPQYRRSERQIKLAIQKAQRGKHQVTTEHRMTFTSDHLIDQIIEGRKTATVERLDEQGYLDEWDTGLQVAAVYTVHDSQRKPRCKIKITRIQLCHWNAIPEWLWRGETNENPDEFRDDHISYFGNVKAEFEFVGIQFELVKTTP